MVVALTPLPAAGISPVLGVSSTSLLRPPPCQVSSSKLRSTVSLPLAPDLSSRVQSLLSGMTDSGELLRYMYEEDHARKRILEEANQTRFGEHQGLDLTTDLPWLRPGDHLVDAASPPECLDRAPQLVAEASAEHGGEE